MSIPIWLPVAVVLAILWVLLAVAWLHEREARLDAPHLEIGMFVSRCGMYGISHGHTTWGIDPTGAMYLGPEFFGEEAAKEP